MIRERREVIGYSELKRPLKVFYLGDPNAAIRIFIMAGQHGDEPLAREGLFQFLYKNRWLKTKKIQMALLVNANPDGAILKSRYTAGNKDLNRDHALLLSPETCAIHRFVRKFSPHIGIDVHCYPPRRKFLLKHHLIHCHDIFLDSATHPNVTQQLPEDVPLQLLTTLSSKLNTEGFISERYILITQQGNIRHSTLDIVDARNGLSLRYGMLTLLLEARTPKKREDPGHIIEGIVRTLILLLNWTEKNQAVFLSTSHKPTKSASVVISASYVAADKKTSYRFKDTQTRDIRVVTLPGAYKMSVINLRTATPPTAYGIPTDLISLNETLSRHGFQSIPGKSYRCHRVEAYWIEAIQYARYPNRAPKKLKLSKKDLSNSDLSSYLIFPLSPKTVIPLTVYLEPASKYGLVRFKEMGVSMKTSSFYPILRLFDALPLIL